MAAIWNRDPISTAQLLLQQANEIWYRQNGTAPDPDRTQQIDALLAEAEQRIADIRAALA